jgi:hypothetical protein
MAHWQAKPSQSHDCVVVFGIHGVYGCIQLPLMKGWSAEQ